jgi:nucleoside-diphosphate-sugar epimerase
MKLVDGGKSKRTFLYIKDAIEAVLLMIVSILFFSDSNCVSTAIFFSVSGQS